MLRWLRCGTALVAGSVDKAFLIVTAPLSPTHQESESVAVSHAVRLSNQVTALAVAADGDTVFTAMSSSGGNTQMQAACPSWFPSLLIFLVETIIG